MISATPLCGTAITRTPVIAAVPNFNMADSLGNLIPQLLTQRYDRIIVLDDASRDHSVDVVKGFGDDVELLRSRENQGAGANRNQIIGHVGADTIIHFIDADMDLKTRDTPNVARHVFGRYADRGVGVVGGLVTRADGAQEYCNYGAVFSLRGNLGSNGPRIVDGLRDRPRLARAVRRVAAGSMTGWPDVTETPTSTPVYWVHEGNMLIKAGVFEAIGGYDPQLRHHEVQDLAIRLHSRGVRTQFDPSIQVVHQHIDVRGKNRSKWAKQATRYLIRKHGLYRFLTDK